MLANFVLFPKSMHTENCKSANLRQKDPNLHNLKFEIKLKTNSRSNAYYADPQLGRLEMLTYAVLNRNHEDSMVILLLIHLIMELIASDPPTRLPASITHA